MSTSQAVPVSKSALPRVPAHPPDAGAALSFRSLESIGFETTYSKGSFLFREWERPQGIVIVKQGTVKLSMASADGMNLIVRTAGAGEVLGLSAAVLGCPYQLTAETLQPCRVKLIWREDFLDWLITNPEATFWVAEQLADEYNATAEQMRALLLPQTASQRLAHLLLHLGVQREDEGSRQLVNRHARVRLSLTHQEIADMIGASRETVTRLLALLRRKQLIQLKGSTLVIPDRSELQKIERGLSLGMMV